eukprot:Hpha_TRINITY_DN10777_c0_g1::TRINITY_DN10777_c0_g1_i1::g.43794::m.43794/K08991/MUS81; crossover junction endonuclease MUS81
MATPSVNEAAAKYLEKESRSFADSVTKQRLQTAADSLRRYPLVVSCGDAARDLAGVGAWVASRLDVFFRSAPAQPQAVVSVPEEVRSLLLSQGTGEEEPRTQQRTQQRRRQAQQAPQPAVGAPSASQAGGGVDQVAVDTVLSLGLEGVGTRQRAENLLVYFDGGVDRLVDAALNGNLPENPPEAKRRRRQEEEAEAEEDEDEDIPPPPRLDWRTFVDATRPPLPAGESPLKVTLLVDHRERLRRSHTAFLKHLRGKSVACESRQLPLGDFVWIATSPDAPGREVVLDLIIERKRASDLASAIITGRYQSQKRRLREGKLGRRVYLLEGSCEDQRVLPAAALQTALFTTALYDGIAVEVTTGLDATCNLLNRLTKILQRDVSKFPSLTDLQRNGLRLSPLDPPFAIFNGGEPPGGRAPRLSMPQGLPDWDEWVESEREERKSKTAEELFPLMLAAANGCSVEAAVAVARTYPSPASLHAVYQEYISAGRSAAAALLLGAIPVRGQGDRSRFVGDAPSTLLFETFTGEY